jgi:small conductance mechanosensitive channel
VLDHYGLVEDINLAMTHMTNEDGEQIVIPNKHLIGEVLVNSHANRVVEGVVGISYDDDPEAAIAVARAVLAADEDVCSPADAQVGIQAFGESSVDIAYRYWVPTTAFFEVQYRVNLALWRALGEAGVTIPFPQRDVRVVSAPGEA